MQKKYMSQEETRNKLLAAFDLLTQGTTTREKFESLRTLIYGINPKIDDILGKLSKVHSDLSKLEQGEIIELTVENLPAGNEREKKRKKAILLFIRYWKQLQSEIQRVKSEFEKNGKTGTEKTTNILSQVKGPLGIATIVAVIIVAGGLILNSQKPKATLQTSSPKPESTKTKIKVIDFNGKKIPLSELTIGIGTECKDNNVPQEHYHAKDHTKAKAADGTIVQDPGGCGFGKVNSTKIEEI